jgi:ADP-ribosylglycohydrolase
MKILNIDFIKNIFHLKYNKSTYQVLSGLFGICVGDALGVPVEFKSRELLKEHPVKCMIGHGTHNQPIGTWSDDSSLTFCLAESLCTGFDTDDIGKKFCNWQYNGYWTADNCLPFDIGASTAKAISRIKIGVKAEEAGLTEESNNGNGSLMRILPLVFYLMNYDGNKFEVVEKVSSITHRNIYSKIACSIYIEMALNILKGMDKYAAYDEMRLTVLRYYIGKGYTEELKKFKRILIDNIHTLKVDDIKSSGYVLDTLEASLWCFLRAKNYSEAVLSAINLGGDTDTTGAVTGGLAGLYFGFKNIPNKWIRKIKRKDEIIQLSKRLAEKI